MDSRVKLLFVVCLSSVSLAKYTRKVSYQGEVLVKCYGLHGDTVHQLLVADGVDVWHVGDEGSVDFRVSSKHFKQMKRDLPECREVGNVEDLVKEEEQSMEKRYLNRTQEGMAKHNLNRTEEDWFDEYHSYNDIVNWYKSISELYPSLTTFVPSIGKSVEGRDMPAFHITAAPDPDKVNKIYFQCQIHAREWISGATCTYFVSFLTEGYDTDERVKELLDSAEFIFIVFMNPDGYEYTWSTDRLWRKNRRPPPEGSNCFGVDLNRNYPYKWGEYGSSPDPCSEIYHGSGPASEPEVQNSINYFRSHMPIVGAVDWHSYGQLLLRPYGWTSEDAPDEARMKEIGDQMSAAIFGERGALYVSQKAIGLYPTSGTARDWFYSEDANAENEYRSAGYTIELRDTGQYGFLLPPEQIIPTGEEVMQAVLVFAETLNKSPIPKN